jgi:hypothetical protein
MIDGPGAKIPAYAQAYDPDNSDTATCAGVGPDGDGIMQVEFQFFWWDGMGWAWRYTSVDYTTDYCGFGGNAPCNGHPVVSAKWPNGQPIESGQHKLSARALDDEGVWSDWAEVMFNIGVPPTPTPTLTPTPSCEGVSFGQFRTVSFLQQRSRRSMDQQHQLSRAGGCGHNRQLESSRAGFKSIWLE